MPPPLPPPRNRRERRERARAEAARIAAATSPTWVPIKRSPPAPPRQRRTRWVTPMPPSVAAPPATPLDRTAWDEAALAELASVCEAIGLNAAAREASITALRTARGPGLRTFEDAAVTHLIRALQGSRADLDLVAVGVLRSMRLHFAEPRELPVVVYARPSGRDA
jgi:hypothetical protein